eukprot:1075379-Pyramimonas_sp.AAC.1
MNLSPAGGISAERQHAGPIIQERHFGGTDLEWISKVDAHRDLHEEGISERAGKRPAMSPTGHEVLTHQIKLSRAVLLAGAELLPLWRELEFRGLKRFPPLPASVRS